MTKQELLKEMLEITQTTEELPSCTYLGDSPTIRAFINKAHKIDKAMTKIQQLCEEELCNAD